MAQVIVLHWDQAVLRAVVVGRRVAHSEVDAVLDIPLDESDDAAAIGQRLSEALEPHRPGRAKIILALGRDALTWQHLALPPCPPEDLPDLVYLQAGFDTSHPDEDVGFDFLPLVGDESTPNEVMAISAAPNELARIQEVCQEADLTLKRIVPLSLGWPAATRRATRGDEQPVGVFVAPYAQEAAVWATVGWRLVLFRRVRFPETQNLDTLSTAVAGEIRRTLFALSQQHPHREGASAWIVGRRPDNISDLVEKLSDSVAVQIEPMDFSSDSALLSTKIESEVSTSDIIPLAGLALEEAIGNAPPVDLLHPRQKPAPRTGQRTYVLLAAAILAVLAYFGWWGYGVLNAPLEKAAIAQIELDQLTELEEELRTDEQFSETIEKWLGESVNVLTEMRQLSERIRPLPLDAEDFDVDKDVVLNKLDFGSKRIDLEAAVRTYPAVAVLETRLRQGTGRVQRDLAEENEPSSQYLWLISASVDFADDTESEELPKK